MPYFYRTYLIKLYYNFLTCVFADSPYAELQCCIDDVNTLGKLLSANSS